MNLSWQDQLEMRAYLAEVVAKPAAPPPSSEERARFWRQTAANASRRAWRYRSIALWRKRQVRLLTVALLSVAAWTVIFAVLWVRGR